MTWQVAAASVLGRHHRILGKNRQDAFCHRRKADAVAIAVTDGCGSAPHSEVGAYLGAHAAVDALLADAPLAEAVQRVIVPTLVEDAFLFTLVAALITPAGARVICFGDGGIRVADEAFVFHDDAPDYLAYHAQPTPRFDRFFAGAREVVLATDGATIPACDERFFTHPDALRRALAKSDPEDDATVVWVRR